MANPIQIIQGAQYGSEAKGAIAAHFCQRDNIDFAVRTGATNAGHTVVYKGVPVKMQQLPVGWVNPTTQLILGAGAVIDLEILRREIALVKTLTGVNPMSRLTVDYRASVHLPSAAEKSRQSDRHHLIGATGKGCSEAIMDKIRLRGMSDITMGALPERRMAPEFPLADTARLLNTSFDAGASIQLEGTQGTLLDLHLGPYPYVTHKQTGPAQWMMEAGLSPALPTDIVLVARTFPIRVAGNSGPLPNETSWPRLARRINARLAEFGQPSRVPEDAIASFEAAVRAVTLDRWSGRVPAVSDGLDQHMWMPSDRLHFRDALSEIHRDALSILSLDTLADLSNLFELTTVTKKLRRVAEMSMSDMRTSISLNRPHRMVLTFLNYLFPEAWGRTSVTDMSQEEWQFIRDFEDVYHTPLTHVTYGPGPEHVIAIR